MFSFLKIFLSVTAILLVSLGCTSNNSVEWSSSNIKILMGNSGFIYPTFYIESIEPNILRFVSFGSVGSVEDYNFDVFDATLIDDFISKEPFIEFILSSLQPSQCFNNVITNEWMLEFSQDQLDHVLSLVENVVRNRPDGEFEPAGLGWLPYVWLIIDGNMYWSFYTVNIDEWDVENPPHINNELLYLIYEIIDLSPYSIRGWATPNSRN